MQRFGIDQAINASKFVTPNRVASTYKKAANTTEGQHPFLKVFQKVHQKVGHEQECMWPRVLHQNFVQITNSSKSPVTKDMFIVRHILVVLFLSKIIIKSKSIPDRTVSLNLRKIVICQTLLLIKRFSSKYHLIHEMFKITLKIHPVIRIMTSFDMCTYQLFSCKILFTNIAIILEIGQINDSPPNTM